MPNKRLILRCLKKTFPFSFLQNIDHNFASIRFVPLCFLSLKLILLFLDFLRNSLSRLLFRSYLRTLFAGRLLFRIELYLVYCKWNLRLYIANWRLIRADFTAIWTWIVFKFGRLLMLSDCFLNQVLHVIFIGAPDSLPSLDELLFLLLQKCQSHLIECVNQNYPNIDAYLAK